MEMHRYPARGLTLERELIQLTLAATSGPVRTLSVATPPRAEPSARPGELRS